MDDRLTDILELAVHAAQHASELILSAFRTDRLTAILKSDGSPVTEIDREAEHKLRDFIKTRQGDNWPILGEELGGNPFHFLGFFAQRREKDQVGS